MATRAARKTSRGYIRPQAAPPVPVGDAPPTSCLHKTAPYEDEVDALDSYDFATFNVLEVDRRIALLARIVLEAALRDKSMSRKDKADLALRAINTLEGTKSQLWVKDASKPIPIDVDTYEREMIAVEAEIKKLAARRDARKASVVALDAIDTAVSNRSSS